MSSRFIMPFADVGSGIKPSSGAKLFFFEVDGTTPKDTFSDQLSTPTANTNPVIADSNGVFGDIYIIGNYKVTLQDKNGSQIFGLAAVSEFITGDTALENVHARDTLNDIVTDTSLQDGWQIGAAERTTGNGGGAMWDIVLSSTVTENAVNIVQCTGVGTLSAVLRIDGEVRTTQLCDNTGGTVDDSAGLLVAFALAAAQVKLIVDGKHLHNVNLPCVTSGVVDIEFTGDGEIITDSSMADQTALWISHLPYVVDTNVYYDSTRRSGGVSLTVNTTKGDPDITVADGSGFSKGDYIYIISTTDYIPALALFIKKGENRKISKVVGNVITLDGGIDDDYFFAGTTAFKYNPPIVSIKNLKMSGADDGNGLRGVFLYECASLDINHMTVTGYNLRDVELAFCVGGVILNPNNDFADKAGASSSYSLVIGASRDLSVFGGALRGGRHSFSTGGQIPCRNILVDGLVCYWANFGSNGQSSFDVHLQMIGFKAVNCTVYGAMDIAGENLEASGNTIYLKDGGNLRGLVARVYKNTSYVKLNDNIVHSLNSSGGIVIRHMQDNVLINKVEQDNNEVFVSTPNARPALGLEPNSVSGSLIRQLSQSNNHIDLRDSSDSAVGIGNYDINQPTSLISIEHTICEDNYVLCLNGTPLRYDCDDKNTGRIEGNILKAESDVNAAFTITNFSQLNFDKNHCSMSTTALAANKGNLFDAIDRLNIGNGSITNSYYDGYQLLNVTEDNPVNLERINCVVNTGDVTRTNAKFIPHSWTTVTGATGAALDSFNCTPSRLGGGNYRITFTNRQFNSTDYPILITPATDIGWVITRVNFNAFDITFTGSVDTDFSVITF